MSDSPAASEPSPELDLLRVGMRASLEGGGIAADFPSLLDSVDWQRVLWLGRQQGALLFLYEALKTFSVPGKCPPKVLAQLEALRQANHLRSLARGRELCLLQDLFDRHGIRALSLDHWMLAHRCGEPSGRVELGTNLRYLVPSEQLACGRALLHEAGHPTEADQQKIIQKDLSPVLLSSPLGSEWDALRLWSAASPFTVGGRNIHCLSPLHWLFQRVEPRYIPPATNLFRAWEIVSLSREIDDGEWSRADAEASKLGLSGHWAGAIAACFDTLHLPRPYPLAHVSAHQPVPSDPGPHEVSRAPFLPTPSAVARRMLELASTGPMDLVCDLGCGDGRLVVSAAKEFGARAIGVDLDPVRIAEATEHAVAQQVSGRVNFVCSDLMAQGLSGVTVLCLYLLPGFYPRIRQKLVREARPGTRIVSHNYVFPDWPPEATEIVRTGLLRVSQIYLWRLP